MKNRFMKCSPVLLFAFVSSVIVVLYGSALYSQDAVQENMLGSAEETVVEDLPGIIVINYDDNFAPLSYGEDGNITGILVEVLDDLLVDRLGLKVEHRGYSGRRARFMVKTGKSDAFCAEPISGAKEYAWFARTPVVRSSSALFTGVDNPRKEDIGTVSTLAGMRAFSQVDYLGSAWAKKTFPKDMQAGIHWVGSQDAAFKMLAINRYDIYVGSEIVGRYKLVKIGLADDIFVRRVSIGKPVVLHFGLRKTYPDAQGIIADVERVLKEAESEGAISRIVEKYIKSTE